MIDLLSYFCKKDHPIWLNKEFHLDLQWGDHLFALWHASVFGCTQDHLLWLT